MWAGKSQCWNFCLRSIFCSRMFISSWVAVSCVTNMPAKELLRPGHGICRLKNICIHVQGFMSLPAIARYEAKLPRSWVSAITLCKARLPKSRVSCAFAFDMQHHIKFWCSCCFTKKKCFQQRVHVLPSSPSVYHSWNHEFLWDGCGRKPNKIQPCCLSQTGAITPIEARYLVSNSRTYISKASANENCCNPYTVLDRELSSTPLACIQYVGSLRKCARCETLVVSSFLLLFNNIGHIVSAHRRACPERGELGRWGGGVT